jgi:hypothetical protein
MFAVKLPITQHNIPEDPNSQHYCFGNVEYRVLPPFSMAYRFSFPLRSGVMFQTRYFLYLRNLME